MKQTDRLSCQKEPLTEQQEYARSMSDSGQRVRRWAGFPSTLPGMTEYRTTGECHGERSRTMTSTLPGMTTGHGVTTRSLLLCLTALCAMVFSAMSLHADDPPDHQKTSVQVPEDIGNFSDPYADDGLLVPAPSPYSIIVKSDKGRFTSSEFIPTTYKSLTVLGSTEPQYCFNRCIDRGRIYMHFHAGGDNRTYYKHASSSGWSATVTVQISGTGGFVTRSVTMAIAEAKPEQLYMLDATTSFPGNCTGATLTTTSSLTFTISSYSVSAGPPSVASDFRLEFWYVEEVHIDAMVPGETDCSNLLLLPLTLNSMQRRSDNPMTFEWSIKPSCPYDTFPNYQFQLLRLYNSNPSSTYLETNDMVSAIVDWSKALTIETGSKKTELTLTIPEGTGFYTWRVRPIGNYYEGGITNPRNWGCWTNSAADGAELHANALNGSFTSNFTNSTFFYEQFDEEKNWSYGRTFTEGTDDGPRIGEQIVYTDALGHSIQVQAKIQSKDSVLMGQTVYDYTGRASLSSMVAPVGQNYLQYFTNLLKYNTGSTDLYAAGNFDADGNFDDPDPATDSPISEYYSDSNPDLTIPNAGGYPYSRTLFYPDGRIKEQSGVGATHRIGATPLHTSRVYYSSVTDKELVSVFGDEAPNENSCSKLITIDENGVAHVQYVTREGQVIATCLMNNGELASEEGSTISSSGSGDLLNLEGEAINAMEAARTITSGTLVDPYTIQGSKNFILLQPTTVNLEYILHPKNFDVLSGCSTSYYCRNCDYRVNMRIINTETNAVVWPTSTNPLYTVSPTSCSIGVSSPSLTTTVSLPAGSYTVERVVENNYTDGSATPPMTELDKHIASVLSGIPSLESIFSTIFSSTATTASLRLADYRAYLSTHPTYPVVDACRFLTLPDVSCPSLSCTTTSTAEYEEYLMREMGESEHDVTTASLNKYFKTTSGGDKYPPFPYSTSATTRGAFNTMIMHMKSDGSACGWDCEKLWKNWVLTVQLYKSLPEGPSGHARQQDGHDFDLLEAFLDLCGRDCMCGISTHPYGFYSPSEYGYLEYAYKSFSYTLGSNTACETVAGYVGSSWTSGPTCEQWQKLYKCVRSGQTTISSDAKTEGGLPQINCPRPSTPYNHSAPTSEWVAYFKCARELLTTMEDKCTSSCESMRPLFEAAIREKYGSEGVNDLTVYCLVEALVKNCQDGCGLTLTENPASLGSWETPAFLIGTSLGETAFSQRMMGQFDLSFPSCSEPYTLAENTSQILDLLIQYLNKAYQKERKSAALPHPVNFAVYMEDFFESAGLDVPECLGEDNEDLDAFRSLMVYPMKSGYDGKFYRMKSIPTGGVTTCTCTLEFEGDYSILTSIGAADKLNTYLDNSWGKAINSITPVGIVKTATPLLGPGPQPEYYAYAPMALPAPGGQDSLADSAYAFAARLVYPAPTLLAGLPIFLAEPGAGDMVFSTSRGVVATSTTDLFSHHKTGALDSGVWRAFGTIIIQMPQMSVGEPVHRLVVKLTRDSVDGSGLLKRVRLEHSYGVAEHEVLISSVSLLPNDLGTYMTQSFTSTIGKFSESTSGTIGSTTGTLVYTSLTNNKDATAPGFPLKGRYTVKLECEGMCATNSCSICIKWKDPEVIVSTIATVFHEMECADHQLVEARRQLKAQYELLIEQLRTDLVSSYRGHCLGLANLDDELNLSYDEKYYHYTLYYYDRAGHLVRTVPPAGVDLSGASSMTRAGHPGHTLKTEYDYNSLGQLVRQYTPDGGETSYEYNSVGQLRFSQNAVQVTTGSYSYTKYDQLGRVTEVGQYTGSISGLADNPAAPTSNTGQVTAMIYSTPISPPSPYGSLVQENLQNRISYAVYDEYPLFGGEEVSTYYSYDAHGNVQWVIQDIPGLTASKTDYEYDLISGNMKQVKYRDGYPDRFYHRYEYDKDNRLVGVETSRDSVLWEHDARYEYYGHGPLRRVAIGEDSVQGIDYVYTIQGWLKGINHPSLSSSDDPGGDDGTTFPKDVFGMTLGYYSGDFDRTSSPYATGSTHDLAPAYNLYNGNITSWSTNTTPLSLVGNTFHYDVLNRLREDQYNKYSSGWSTANDYNTWNTYDANGNLTLMRRNTYESSTVKEMDKLEYHYVSGTNKLDYVHDAGAQDGVTGPTGDIRIGQAPGNYRYDNMGRLVGDNQGLLKSTWNVYNKVIDVQTTSGHSVYGYDAMGSRVKKDEYVGGGGSPAKTTWYVNDASGQVMSIYEKTGDDIIQTEVPIYGSGRLGEATTGTVRSNTLVGDYLGLYDRYIDKKVYELSDHLGNVRAVISDLKEEDGGSFKAILKGYMNFYPYGQLQTGRSSNSADYRYGYNGVEQENDVQGNGNLLSTEFRMFDPRLGRWWGRDPIVKTWESPYAGMGNNPILFADPSGLDGEAGENAQPKREFYRPPERPVTVTPGDMGGSRSSNTATVQTSTSNATVGNGSSNSSSGAWNAVLTWFTTPMSTKSLWELTTGLPNLLPTDYYVGQYARTGEKIPTRSVSPKQAMIETGIVAAPVVGAIFIEEAAWAALLNPVAAQGLLESITSPVPSLTPLGFVKINPNLIRFSQTSVNGVAEIEASMRLNGWVGEAIDVIKIENTLVTMDNTRVLAASRANILVHGVIHDASEVLSPDLAERFTTRYGVPKTWGDALMLRIGKQNIPYKTTYPQGSYITGSKE